MAAPYDGSGYIAGPAAPPPAALPFLPGYRIQTVPVCLCRYCFILPSSPIIAIIVITSSYYGIAMP
jgi:hypothetical protein